MKLVVALAIVALMGVGVALAQSKGSGSGSGSATHTSPPSNQSRPPQQPYGGQQERPVSGLSDREIVDLEAGHGMGMALPAELNGYPGPLHVLQFADALKLTPEQRGKVQASFDFMQAQAQGLGRTYIEAEKALASSFRAGRVDAKVVAERVKAIEAVRSELRQVHLLAHIETAALLTDQQKAIYEALRGYVRAGPGSSAKGLGSGADRASAGTSGMCRPGSTESSGSCCCQSASASGGCGMSCGSGR